MFRMHIVVCYVYEMNYQPGTFPQFIQSWIVSTIISNDVALPFISNKPKQILMCKGNIQLHWCYERIPYQMFKVEILHHLEWRRQYYPLIYWIQHTLAESKWHIHHVILIYIATSGMYRNNSCFRDTYMYKWLIAQYQSFA